MSQLCTIIGLTGRSGSGKDTCAELIQQLDGRFIRLAFADALKQEVSESFGVDTEYLHNRALKEGKYYNFAIHRSDDDDFIERMRVLGLDLYYPRSPREIMQFWGNEYRRHQDENYWANQGLELIHQLIADGTTGIVITDIRFVNEAELVKNCGGRIVRIHRKKADERPIVHPSENLGRLTSYVDYTLRNQENNLDAMMSALKTLLKDIQADEKALQTS